MELLLTDDQKMLQDSAARLCGRASRNTGEDLDRDTWAMAAEAGWIGVLLDLGVVELGLLQHQVGLHDARIPLAPTAIAIRFIAAGAAEAVGLMDAVLAGKQIVVPAVDGNSSDFSTRGEMPRADRQGGRLLLDGGHAAVPGAALADWLLVAAQDAHGGSVLCLARPSDTGVTLRRHALVDGSSLCDVTFAGAEIAPDRIVAEGAGTAARIDEIRALQSMAASFELLGVGDATLALTLEHLKLRRQFGRPIGAFQALQHRAVDGFVALELVRSLAFRVAGAFDKGQAHPAMIPALKAKVGRDVLAIARRGVQIHGALGYAAGHDIGNRYKRALALSARHGNEAQQYAQFANLAGETSA